jgi:hypothetical protein
VNTIEELLGRKSSGSGLESREYGRMDPPRWPHGTLYPQKLTLTSPTSGGRSVGIVRSRTQATELRYKRSNFKYFRKITISVFRIENSFKKQLRKCLLSHIQRLHEL